MQDNDYTPTNDSVQGNDDVPGKDGHRTEPDMVMKKEPRQKAQLLTVKISNRTECRSLINDLQASGNRGLGSEGGKSGPQAVDKRLHRRDGGQQDACGDCASYDSRHVRPHGMHEKEVLRVILLTYLG